MTTNLLSQEADDAKSIAQLVFLRERRASVLVPLFTNRLPARALGFPFDQCDLTPHQWANFVSALRASGVSDQQAFATTLFTVEGYWKVRLDEQQPPYVDLIRRGWPSVFESAIYSVTGDWAIAVSIDGFALAGGSERFVEYLRRSMPEFGNASVRKFVLHWRREVATLPPDSPPYRLIPDILEHTYGAGAEPWLRLFYGED